MKMVYVIGGGTCIPFGREGTCALDNGLLGNTLFSMLLEHHAFKGRQHAGATPLFRTQFRRTRMADPYSPVVTNADVLDLLRDLRALPETRVIFLVPTLIRPATRVGRLATTPDEVYACVRAGAEGRKDVFLVVGHESVGLSEQDQYIEALDLLKRSSANLALSRDSGRYLDALDPRDSGRWMVVAPEEARYHVGRTAFATIEGAIRMALARSEAHFTRSAVVGTEADLVPWADERVPANLRAVVDHCIARGAYKPFRGSTAGHFAVKLDGKRFLTSVRKRDFNRRNEIPILVEVETLGLDRVVAHGARPPTDAVNVRDQAPFECGSHECGRNTSEGLGEHVLGSGRVKAVMLDGHGPNIVFGRDAPAEEVIAFIERNFDLSQKTGGPVA